MSIVPCMLACLLVSFLVYVYFATLVCSFSDILFCFLNLFLIGVLSVCTSV